MSHTPLPATPDDSADEVIIDLVDVIDVPDPTEAVGGAVGVPRASTSGRLAAVAPEIDEGVERAIERITGNHLVVPSDDDGHPVLSETGSGPVPPQPVPTPDPERALEGMLESFYGSSARPPRRQTDEGVQRAEHTLATGAARDVMVTEDTAPPKFLKRNASEPEPIAAAILREYFDSDGPIHRADDTLVDGLPDARAMMDALVPPGSAEGLDVTQPPAEDRYDLGRGPGGGRPRPLGGGRGLDTRTAKLLEAYLTADPRGPARPVRPRANRAPAPVLTPRMSTEELLAAYVAEPAVPSLGAPQRPPAPVEPIPPLRADVLRAPELPLATRPPRARPSEPPPPPRYVPPLPPSAGGPGAPPPPMDDDIPDEATQPTRRAAPRPRRRSGGLVERTSGVAADDEARRSGMHRAVGASASGMHRVASSSGMHRTAPASGIHRLASSSGAHPTAHQAAAGARPASGNARTARGAAGPASTDQTPVPGGAPPVDYDPEEANDTLELSDTYSRQVLRDALAERGARNRR